MTHLNVSVLTVVIGTVIPFITGVVAKEKNTTVKAVVNALIAAVSGAITIAIADGGAVPLWQWVLGIATTWFASLVTYEGFWKPTGIVDRAVEWAAKQLAKIGIHLPQAELVSIEDFLQSIFGEAVQFLTAEEAKLHFGGGAAPAPVTNVTNVVSQCCGGACGSKDTQSDKPPADALQGPGHNFCE